jgi:predicted DNA-binding helix-hairpin-helix protein
LIDTVEALYREVGLRRAYFSAFSPVSQSRLQEHPATPPLREHRLYQTDWLLRIYGFSLPEVELALGPQGNLPLKIDPKLAIARKRPDLYPVDVNRASYEELLRIPGIGPVSARRIVDSREDHSINSLQQLRKMKVATRGAVPYLWFKGMLEWEKQMSFLPEVDEEETAPGQRGLAEIVS